jgi:hypothetical protein
MKFKAPSRVWVRCLRSRIWKEGTADHKERNSTARSARKLNGAHHGVRPPVEIQILHFFLVFFWYIFVILYHLRKHTNFQLNWTEGVAYWNSTSFTLKFKASPRLWVRCLRIWSWASSHGEILHGRHSRSQRKKQQNTIRTKAQWSPPRGWGTSRNPNFALFARIFLYFFWFCIT